LGTAKTPIFRAYGQPELTAFVGHQAKLPAYNESKRGLKTLPTPIELMQIAVRHGCEKKRNNAIAAALCGALPALALSFYFSSIAWRTWLFGLIVGLTWGNALEYLYHRWLLHTSLAAS
jgi:hypothetical protein